MTFFTGPDEQLLEVGLLHGTACRSSGMLLLYIEYEVNRYPPKLRTNPECRDSALCSTAHQQHLVSHILPPNDQVYLHITKRLSQLAVTENTLLQYRRCTLINDLPPQSRTDGFTNNITAVMSLVYTVGKQRR